MLKKRDFKLLLSGCLFGLMAAFFLDSYWLSSLTNQGIKSESYLFFEDVLKSHHPVKLKESITEEIAFRYFDSETSFQIKTKLLSHLNKFDEELLGPAKDLAFRYVNRGKDSERLVFRNGRYRWLPYGVEYEFLFQNGNEVESIQVIQPLGNLSIIRKDKFSSDEVVNIILPLQGRIEMYRLFLGNLVENILPVDPHIHLFVVYFKDEFLNEARNITQSVSSQLKVTFVTLPESSFSRGRGLQVGAHYVASRNSTLLFFCDVDVVMKPQFFTRCRSNAALKMRVYYPVLYSLYNPKLIYPLLDMKIPHVYQQLEINENTGFWRSFGYGMVCMYLEDFISTGEFSERHSWGSEDIELYEKFQNLPNMKIVRSPDPDIFHVYHYKDCKNVDSKQYPSCLMSKAMSEGSQMELGFALFKTSEEIDFEGILSKRFYYFWLVPYLSCLVVMLAVTLLLLLHFVHRQSKMSKEMKL